MESLHRSGAMGSGNALRWAAALCALYAICGAFTTTAYGQEMSGTTLEEVIVTAQKKEESLQDAPVSVSVLSGADIAAGAIKDPTGVQSKLPGIEFQYANEPVLVIRGVGTYNNQPGVDSAVAYVEDGTYLSHTAALTPILFDIQSIEAVRGPQGTLYGRNSNGGALSITTNKPVLDSWQASASLTAGNYGDVGSQLVLNAPIASTAAVRVAFATDNHEGYFADGSQGANDFAGRLRFLYEPSDALNVLVTADDARQHSLGQGSDYCPENSGYPACASVNKSDPYAGYGPGHQTGHYMVDNAGIYAEINYRMDWATLTSISNYRRYGLETLWVWDYVDYEPDSDNKFFTQEIRLASNSKAPGALDWVVGAYYSMEWFNALESYNFFDLPSLRFRWNDATSTSRAVFAQVDYPIDESLKVTAGLRYTNEVKSQFGSATVYDATGTIPTTVATGAALNQGRVTGKFGLEYNLTAQSMLYASISNGFKSGGVNQVPPGIGLTQIYQPETVVAYQAGSKNRYDEDRIQLNAEAFYYDYKGYQQYTQESDPTHHFPSVFFITEASQKATFYGGEAEASFLVSSAGQLDLSVTGLHAVFDQFVVGAIDNTGHAVQGAPKYTVGAAYQHTVNCPGGGSLRGRLGTQVLAGHFIANENTPGSYQDTYSTTDATLTYTTPGRSWTLTAFARNLENRAIIESYADPISRGGDIGFLQAPRTWGATVSWTLR
jgi:iron complex outermembrane receptor protein